MSLDQTQNFVRVGVAGTHSDIDTIISLDDASVMPDPSNGNYNLVWWDDKTYSRPDNDPNVEIVRVTGRDTTNDTIIVTRGQENTSATTKNNSDNDYQIMLSPTKKTFTDLKYDIHNTSIDDSITIDSDEGMVLSGPVTGSGSISGDGSFSVL